MTLSRTELEREAAATGFQPEPLEKVVRLFELLQSLKSHPFLKNRLALKGGTALNLFWSDVPRLSVDLDLNYVFRIPLWPLVKSDSYPVGVFHASGVPVLDIHELAAGKLAALFARNASRDLFDACTLLRNLDLNQTHLRLGFVVYGGINRKDWREISMEDIRADSREVEQQLIPMLRADLAPDRSEIEAWTKSLVKEARERLSGLLPLDPGEMQFIRCLNELGEIRPDLITADQDMQAAVLAQPGLLWKSLNVRKMIGKE